MRSHAPTSPQVLAEVRTAMHELIPRVCQLVASLENPAAPAIGVWNAVETAVHLVQTMEADLAAVTGSFPADRAGLLEKNTLGGLDEVTQRMVRDEPERDPLQVARRIRSAAEALAGQLSQFDDDRPVSWLGRMQLALSAIGAHVVEESLVHGRDIARSQGRPWPIAPAHATTAVGGFVLPLMEALDPAESIDRDAASGLSAVFEFRIRRTGRICFVFDHGSLEIELIAPSLKARCPWLRTFRRKPVPSFRPTSERSEQNLK